MTNFTRIGEPIARRILMGSTISEKQNFIQFNYFDKPQGLVPSGGCLLGEAAAFLSHA